MSTGWVAVVNPMAGGGKKLPAALRSLSELRNEGVPIEVCVTASKGEASALVRRKFLEGTDRFISVGGDGTAFEVLNGLFPEALSTGRTPKMALLPVGTGNSFLREFTSKGLSFSRQAIKAGVFRRCDVAHAFHAEGSFYFMNLLSLGFVADVAALRNDRLPKLGQLGYVLAVLLKTAALRPRAYSFSLDGGDGEQGERTFLSINNTKFTGGNMKMSPYSTPMDGKLDLVEAYPMTRRGLIRAFPKIFSGRHVKLASVRSRAFARAEFSFPCEVPVMVDGETMRVNLREVRVVPSALEICA